MSRFLVIMVIFISTLIADIFFVDIKNDSVTFYHNETFLNCNSKIKVDIIEEVNYIKIFEIDTTTSWDRCMCYYDIHSTITGLLPGKYTAEFFGAIDTNYLKKQNSDTLSLGLVEFCIGENRLLSSTNSGCIKGLNKSVTTDDILLISEYYSNCKDTSWGDSTLRCNVHSNELTFSIYNILYNCNESPNWDYYFFEDTLHIEMIDTTLITDSKEFRDLSLTFGLFPDGKFVLDFMPELFDYGTFIVGSKITAIPIDDNIQITWSANHLNCGTEPVWKGEYINDTLFVNISDTGNSMYCVCPFTFTADFGPFPSGDIPIVFNAWDEFKDTLICTIPLLETAQNLSGIEFISFHQSDCKNPVNIEKENKKTPDIFNLFPPYPNPFNPSTTISFTLDKKENITLTVYNINGQCVDTIVKDELNAGFYCELWFPEDLSSGTYFVKLTKGMESKIQKVVFIK